ncbi:MAG: hypothetical protein KAJ23_12115 [Maribacter sp.]|nr:hypothetical protein [Maribacter sp.]
MKVKSIIIGIIFASLILGCETKDSIHGLSAYKNLDSLAVFAPELAVKGNTYKGSFSDDYTHFYYFKKSDSVSEKYIPYQSHFKNNHWNAGTGMPYYDKAQSYTYQLNIPSSDLHIFISNLRTTQDTTAHPNYNFWSVLTPNGNWESPKELGPHDLVLNYNSQPCITRDGTIYFTSDTPDWRTTLSYKMDFVNGTYQEPTLFEPVNHWRENKDWIVYEYVMAPDKSYLIVCIQKKNGQKRLNTDLYISYPKNEKWTFPKPLGFSVNTSETENFPYITPDSKHLIFTRAFSQFYIVPIKQLLTTK